MAFLDKLKAGLSKTKKAIFGQIDEVLKNFVRVDEDMLDELEVLRYNVKWCCIHSADFRSAENRAYTCHNDYVT